MAICMEPGCSCKATHILVNYMHEIVGEGVVYCVHHAFDGDRERCPCCRDYQIEYEDASEGGERIDLLPTYPAGTLDREGCCSEHP